MSWKTVIVNEECKVSLDLNCVLIQVEGEYVKVPLSDISTMLFMHSKMTITLPVISRLVKENIVVIITDNKGDPSGIFLPFSNHSSSFKKLEQQLAFSTQSKRRLWKQIIEQKIRSELMVLKMLNLSKDRIAKLNEYKNDVKNDDSTNREGVAAKLYFQSLFGLGFTRDDDIAINYALNYGYKIIASYISKQIVARGLITQLGVKHRGASNHFNLTYDFIEIFRYIVDYWVVQNVCDDIFDNMIRFELVNILNSTILIDDKLYILTNAIDYMIDSYILYLESGVTISYPQFETIEYAKR